MPLWPMRYLTLLSWSLNSDKAASIWWTSALTSSSETLLCRAKTQASAVSMSHTSRLAASKPDCLPLQHAKQAYAAASTPLALPDLQKTHFWRVLSWAGPSEAHHTCHAC